MAGLVEYLDAARHAQDLSETWQARTLREARGKQFAVLLSVLAHNFDEAMPVLLRIVFPGFTSIRAPFLTTAARVGKSGQITADMVTINGQILKQAVLYSNEVELRDDFRRLADDLKLSDRDRCELFTAVKNWVVADTRLDPTMDPRDPDAKRLVH